MPKRNSPERKQEMTERRVRQWQAKPTLRSYKQLGENGCSKYIPAGKHRNVPMENR